MKKGQGISINVIIIAALALLVLVILAVLVLNTGGRVREGTGCEGAGGQCISAPGQEGNRPNGFDSNSHCKTNLNNDYVYAPGLGGTNGCDEAPKMCCVKLG